MTGLWASAASRWVKCPASVALARPEDAATGMGMAARIGVSTHALLVAKMEAWTDDVALDDVIEGSFYGTPVHLLPGVREKDKDAILGVTVTPSMDVQVNTVLRYIRGRVGPWRAHVGAIAVEKSISKVLYDVIGPIPGTPDVILEYTDAQSGGTILEVIDLKSGSSEVIPEGNWQLRVYAIGAALSRTRTEVLDEIRLTIIQPTSAIKVKTAQHPCCDLRAWCDTLLSAVRAIKEGSTVAVPGDHCTWCRAAVRCNAARSPFTDIPPPGDM